MSKFFPKSIIPSIAFAGLASVMMSEPASARRLNACQVKHSYCSERCIMNYNGGAIGACIARTCDRQHPGCGGESIYQGRRGLVASGPQSPQRPGNSGPFVPGGRNPTGGIIPDGINRTGGIVPGGMGRNGGFGSGGAIFRSAFGRR